MTLCCLEPLLQNCPVEFGVGVTAKCRFSSVTRLSDSIQGYFLEGSGFHNFANSFPVKEYGGSEGVDFLVCQKLSL